MIWINLDNVYFIGVGGIGMSALARYFVSQGKTVAGYDRVSTTLTDQLVREGIDICFEDMSQLIPRAFRNPERTLVIYTPAIPEDHQYEGCDSHLIHPDLVPWSFEGSDDGSHVIWNIDGVKVLNGPSGYKSREILANPAACGSSDVEAVKDIFPDTEVVG